MCLICPISRGLAIADLILGVSSGTKVVFLQSDGAIRARVNLAFPVLDWGGDVFLAGDIPKPFMVS